MFALTRLPGWPRRLADYVEARRRTPFAWGEHDCMSFGIGAIEAITGTIVWPVTWSTAIEAARVLEEAGGPIAAVTSVLGAPVTDWRLLRRGDVALLNRDGRTSLVVNLGHALCGPDEAGLAFPPVTVADIGWRVA